MGLIIGSFASIQNFNLFIHFKVYQLDICPVKQPEKFETIARGVFLYSLDT